MYADVSCRPGRAVYEEQGNETAFGAPHDFGAAAGVRLMVVTLSPPEKGFFTGVPHGKIDRAGIREISRALQHDGNEAALALLERLTGQRPQGDDAFLRPLHTALHRIQHFQSNRYDYFQELVNEYRFYLNTAHADSPPFRLLKDKSTTDETPDPKVIFAIGGIHALGVGNPEDDHARPGEPRLDVRMGTLKQRIRQLKGEEPLDDGTWWTHRPLYITLAQHFCNTLFGHAPTFRSPAHLLYHQTRFLGHSMQRPHGLDVIKELLGLSIELHPTQSKRILIDISHLSAASRLDFYKHIIRPFNQRHEYRHLKIPVVASRAAYSGLDRLEELAARERQEAPGQVPRENGFVATSLNLTDEDVIEIFNSRGLLGLTLDKHQLGAEEPMRWWKLTLKSETRVSDHALKRNLRQLVAIPFAYGLDSPLQIWDRLCIGTGFEQFTVPLDRYPGVNQLATLEEDLVKILTALYHEEPLWLGSYRPERLARKLCYENVMEFVKRNY